MQGSSSRAGLVFTTAILLTLLYPALFLGYRVAPEASLKSAPPWRELSGPVPEPSHEVFEAATELGPRLASIAREPLHAALWNPWIGGGRPGWLVSAEEGGAPLVLVSAAIARHGWAWTALLALEIAVALAATWWALRLLGLDGWPAAVGATAYALSGAASGHWLDWQGSALALGPLGVAAVVSGARPPLRRAAVWAAALVALAASGAPAVQFVALAAAALLLSKQRPTRSLWLVGAGAVVLALAVGVPRIWLARHGTEPGASEAAPAAVAPLRTWTATIHAARADGAATGGAAHGATVDQDRFAYLGLGTLLLAALGVISAPPRCRGFWLGVGGTSAALVSAPSSILARLGVTQRPYGVFALAAAALAAYGAQFLAHRLRGARASVAAVSAAWILLAVPLATNAARHIPFVPAEETELATPIPRGGDDLSWRLVGVLGAMPPDSAALLALSDVRAASYPGEPRFAAMIGGETGGEIPVTRAFDPRMARLGVRWLLEPSPLRVVSGEIFSRIELAELRRARGRRDQGSVALDAVVPSGATRLGVPAAAGVRVHLETAERSTELDPDEALQAESSSWTWFAVPPDFPPGSAVVKLHGDGEAAGSTVTVAWDTSGLLLDRERPGARVWECAAARPFVFLASGVVRETGPPPPRRSVVTVPDERLTALLPLANGARGRVELERLRPDRAVARCNLDAPGLLVFQVKFRPRIWRATVGGSPARTERVDGVWTAVQVPRGSSRVELRATLPPLVLGLPAAALAAVALMAVSWRRP